jgi:hypothetical protein
MVAAGVIRIIVHFSLKVCLLLVSCVSGDNFAQGDIISQCTALSEGKTGLVYPFGYFGPVYRDFIDHDDAINCE